MMEETYEGTVAWDPDEGYMHSAEVFGGIEEFGLRRVSHTRTRDTRYPSQRHECSEYRHETGLTVFTRFYPEHGSKGFLDDAFAKWEAQVQSHAQEPGELERELENYFTAIPQERSALGD